MERLDVYLYGVPVAALGRLGPERYRLLYRDEWLDDPNATAVSLSLPLQRSPHGGSVLAAFLDNLLPDNSRVRERWATEAGLETDESFFLLEKYGADVAGAIQLVGAGEPLCDAGQRQHVSDHQIAERVRAIREDDADWFGGDEGRGYFSLGGAQGKFSLGNTGSGWYEPTGVHPTTHILKPRVHGQQDGELIEHLTMAAANLLSIPTAVTVIEEFEDQHALVVERFDRFADADGAVVRLHQEDLAQSFGRTRLQKYEDRGGPSYREILHLLERAGQEASREHFVRALVFSWMVLNTDAHAKNYSLFLQPDGVRLTPLYDVSSLIPYLGRDGEHWEGKRLQQAFDRTKLSMRIAADYEAGEQSWFEWRAVAREAGLDRSMLTEWAVGVAEALPQLLPVLASTLPAHLQTDVVARYVERMPLRSAQVLRAIGA